MLLSDLATSAVCAAAMTDATQRRRQEQTSGEKSPA
jgi:hypothetical protein